MYVCMYMYIYIYIYIICLTLTHPRQTGSTMVKHRLQGHQNYAFCTAISPDSRLIASGGAEKKILIWNANTRELEHTLPTDQGGAVLCLDFSPDGKLLASGGHDSTISLWDVESTPTLLRTITMGQYDTARSVRFSPDGRILAVASSFGRTITWGVRTGKVRLSFSECGGADWCMAWSFDGRLIASGMLHGVYVWDADTRKELAHLFDNCSVWCIAFAAKSRLFASGQINAVLLREVSEEGNVTVKHRLEGHKFDVYGLAFSPEDRYLASVSGDRTVQIWDVAAGLNVRVLRGHTDCVRSVTWSPDGQFIVSGSIDKTVLKWEMDVQVGGH
jgi:WD40 repeat protein